MLCIVCYNQNMKQINKILVATDFSQQSDYAVFLANDLHKKLGATVSMVHISDVSRANRIFWDW